VYERRMRNISCSVSALAIALAAVALAACGPSGKQVATAKQARYQGDRQQIFAVIRQTVAERYKIEQADEASLAVQTVGRWYNPEGQPISANIGDVRDVPDQSLNVALVVQLLPDGEHDVVSVKASIMRYIKGRPNPDTLEENDPSVPGWVRGKGDNLRVAIYEALRQYEVKAASGASPAPGSAAPAAPAPGSAAPAPGPSAPAPSPAPAAPVP